MAKRIFWLHQAPHDLRLRRIDLAEATRLTDPAIAQRLVKAAQHFGTGTYSSPVAGHVEAMREDYYRAFVSSPERAHYFEGVQDMAKRKCKSYKMTRAGRRCASYGTSPRGGRGRSGRYRVEFTGAVYIGGEVEAFLPPKEHAMVDKLIYNIVPKRLVERAVQDALRNEDYELTVSGVEELD